MTKRTEITLALLGDVHYGPDTATKRGSAALGLLHETIDTINSKEPDLVVDLGDRLTEVDSETDTKHLRELRREFERLESPRVHLVGNHDISNLSLQANEEVLGCRLDSHSIQLGGWHLAFWNASCRYRPGVGGLRLRQEDLDWLAGDLASTPLPTVLFSHVPLVEGTMDGNYYFEKRPVGRAWYENSLEARKILERQDQALLAVNGHTHWNALTTVDDIRYFTLHSLTETFTTPPRPTGAWAWVELGEEIRVAVHGQDSFAFQFPLRHPRSHWLTRDSSGAELVRRNR